MRGVWGSGESSSLDCISRKVCCPLEVHTSFQVTQPNSLYPHLGPGGAACLVSRLRPRQMFTLGVAKQKNRKKRNKSGEKSCCWRKLPGCLRWEVKPGGILGIFQVENLHRTQRECEGINKNEQELTGNVVV